MIKFIKIIIIISVSSLYIVFSFFGEAHKNVEVIFNIKEGFSLDVYNQNGSIFISTWRKDKIKIMAKKISYSWGGNKELDLVDIKMFKKKDDKYLIKTLYNNIDLDRVYVIMEIKIPKYVKIGKVDTSNGDIIINNTNGKLILTTSKGKIEVSKVFGSVNAKTDSGNIFLEKLFGNCRLKTSDGRIEFFDSDSNAEIINNRGKIEVINIKGDIDVKQNLGHIDISEIIGKIKAVNSHGNIRIEDVRGDAEISTLVGDLKLYNVKGFISASNTSGNITIEETSGIIKAECVNGNIHADMYYISDEGSSIITQNGNVILYLSPKINADLEVTHTRGKLDIKKLSVKFLNIQSIKPNHIYGVLGHGGPKIFIKTNNGKIKISDL